MGELFENLASNGKMTIRRWLGWMEETELISVEDHEISVYYWLSQLPLSLPSQAPPTLHNEVDPRRLGVVVRLHRAGVWALVIHIHVLDLNAVLGLGVAQEDHTWVQAPLVIPSIEDGATV